MKLVNTMLQATVLAVLSVGCGTAEIVCEKTESETHITTALAQSGDYCMMLHHTEYSCLRVGSNAVHAYIVNDDLCDDLATAPMFEPEYAPLHEASEENQSHGLAVDIQAVDGLMPAHGHGFAKAAELSADNPAQATIHFQMPGEWQVTLDFAAVDDDMMGTDGTTATQDEVVFAVTVRD